jgi:glycosyltransferase involved in cell wall biosynthesis
MRILLVGMANSIHLARWVDQFNSEDHVFEIVSSSPHTRVHPKLQARIVSSNKTSISWISRHFSLPMWLADRYLSDWVRGILIFWRIKSFKPDIVHVHELQNAGYATRRAFQLLGTNRPNLIVTNYGSDIFWFSKLEKHRKKIKSLLEMADGYSAECSRDYFLAAGLTSGYKPLPIMPTAGGLVRRLGPEKVRNKIAIKGYENHWGKALSALNSIAELSELLKDIEIVLYSCDRGVARAAEKLSKEKNISITTHGPAKLSHDQILSIFETSIMYVGHSLSDGISTSMLEAMAMGAIPIQTNTSCAEEWITNGETGFLITPEDSTALKAAVKSILSGEFDVEAARRKNYEVIDDRYDPVKLQAVARTYYENIL